jgi:superfamily I DNA and RNA helicase
MEIIASSTQLGASGDAKLLYEAFQGIKNEALFADCVALFNFPIFRSDDELFRADAVFLSPRQGLVIIGCKDLIRDRGVVDTEGKIRELEEVHSQVFSRLLKYPALRSSRTSVSISISLILVDSDSVSPGSVDDVTVLNNRRSIERFFSNDLLAGPDLPGTQFQELCSVVEGSKALLRPQRDRSVAGAKADSKAMLVAKLEDEIRRFDVQQRQGYILPLDGPERIRGLAGSGKTVILAMKAALTHLEDPDARIAFVFYTKSLYQHVKQLITRFYRLHDDKDPDWSKLEILHAWGGSTRAGFYSTLCEESNVRVLNYSQAGSASKDPFEYSCKDLLEQGVRESFDFVFVDEGQDFGPNFFQLVRQATKNDRFVIAYDELQTIFRLNAPTSADMFGVNENGQPNIEFTRDLILTKCYRNPREILVPSVAVGFGLYGRKIVQIPEDESHWNALGFEVNTGEISPSSDVEVERPARFSPSSISERQSIEQILRVEYFGSLQQEIEFVVANIKNDIEVEGLAPDDIVVISVDDLNARTYFDLITRNLSAIGIGAHNLQDFKYAVPEFSKEGKVTLTTVHKAKGNEGYGVYVVGVDSFGLNAGGLRSRNRAFTAMTRAKGWLCMSGMGVAAKALSDEIHSVKEYFPVLKFKYPSADELRTIKMHLDRDPERQLDDLFEDYDSDEVERILKAKLREIQQRKATRKPKN